MSYRLLSYRAGRAARAGVLVGDVVYDAAKVTGNSAHSSVLDVLEDWNRAKRLLARAAKRIAAGTGRPKGLPLKSARLLAPVLYPGTSTAPAPTTPITWPRWPGPKARRRGRP